LDTTHYLAQLRAANHVDWAGILNGSLAADFDVPTVDFPTSTWFINNPNLWPVTRVRANNVALPFTGRGTIIVDSNFSVGNNNWHGIIILDQRLVHQMQHHVLAAEYRK
jgi:hypothetical protein